METKHFGTTSKHQDTALYTIRNAVGMELSVTDFGATLQSVIVTDKNGNKRDIVLGYDDAKGYEQGMPFFGAVVGRNANRIKDATFHLNGVAYSLDKNEGDNNLHSGFDFYRTRIWKVKHSTDNSITFSLHSPNGDQGFPGDLEIDVTYTLTQQNELHIDYSGQCNQDTIINMTNHSYFNLNGHDSGSVLEQTVWIDANAFTKTDAQSIPTGEIVKVQDTPLDFRTEKKLGQDIYSEYEAVAQAKGYDHNWVLNHSGEMRKVAALCSEKSGIKMEVYTDLPGVQMYTANFFDHEEGKNKTVYRRYQGVCFETQYFPDAMNQPEFKKPIVKAGQLYHTETVYQFTTIV